MLEQIMQNLHIAVPVGIIALAILIAFVKAHTYICSPSEVMIFSGKKRKVDGKIVGYRVVKGGRGFRWPIVESVRTISLENIPVLIELKGALSQGIIPLDVEAIANIKIDGDEASGLPNAIERFLGRSREEITRVARQTLEGSLRGVLATMTPEEANQDRLKFAKKVMENGSEDFHRLGLVIDTFKIQSITDPQGYLQAIGRKKNAAVQRDARIAEAEAEAEARKVSAKARQEGSVAEAKAQMVVVDAENELRVKTAELMAESNRAEAKASVAGRIAEAEQEIAWQDHNIELSKRKQEADVVIPARAEKEAKQFIAEGRAAKILENGKAVAEAIELMRAQWDNGNTRELFLIQQLPHIVEKITSIVSDNLAIEKLTIVDSGGGEGLPNHIRGLTGSVVSVMEEIKNAVGVDIPAIVQAKAKENKSIELKKELD